MRIDNQTMRTWWDEKDVSESNEFANVAKRRRKSVYVKTLSDTK
jgi:hypothetical protein